MILINGGRSFLYVMPEMHVGYKVVLMCDDLKLRSFVCGLPSAVIYKLGEFTERNPECGPLAVFKTFEDAENFLDIFRYDCRCYKIYKCQYVQSKDQKFWYRDADHNLREYVHTKPIGTDFADEVKLLHCIPHRKEFEDLEPKVWECRRN